MPIDILNSDQLKRTIESLQLALQEGFSSDSSPVEPLIEVLIDISLKLRNELLQDSYHWKSRNNPEIKIMEDALKGRGHRTRDFLLEVPGPGGDWKRSKILVQNPHAALDELGNPKSIRIRDLESEKAHSPELAKYFSQLAEQLVEIRKTHRLPKDLYSKGKDERSSGPHRINHSEYWYIRRHQGSHPNKQKKNKP